MSYLRDPSETSVARNQCAQLKAGPRLGGHPINPRELGNDRLRFGSDPNVEQKKGGVSGVSV